MCADRSDFYPRRWVIFLAALVGAIVLSVLAWIANRPPSVLPPAPVPAPLPQQAPQYAQSLTDGPLPWGSPVAPGTAILIAVALSDAHTQGTATFEYEAGRAVQAVLKNGTATATIVPSEIGPHQWRVKVESAGLEQPVVLERARSITDQSDFVVTSEEVKMLLLNQLRMDGTEIGDDLITPGGARLHVVVNREVEGLRFECEVKASNVPYDGHDLQIADISSMMADVNAERPPGQYHWRARLSAPSMVGDWHEGVQGGGKVHFIVPAEPMNDRQKPNDNGPVGGGTRNSMSGGLPGGSHTPKPSILMSPPTFWQLLGFRRWILTGFAVLGLGTILWKVKPWPKKRR